jgi:hypothetical protein
MRNKKMYIFYNRAETWTLSKAESNRLKIFESKIIRKIHGSVNEEG